jgi:hypothetical protein
MASIPLPALSVQPPQTQDTLGQFQKLAALRSLGQQQQLQSQQMESNQQEQQIRAQQIRDQQAMTAAMKTWNGKDYDDLAKSVLENGGSANAATQIQQHGLTIKKTVSDIAAQDATTGSKNLETFIGMHKAIGDALEGIETVPDAQLHDVATQKVTELAKAGIMPPQTAQQALQAIQNTPDPTQLRTMIDNFAKSSMGAKAIADQQKTIAETGASNATTDQKRAESQWYQAHGGAPGVPVEAQQQADWLSKNPGKTPSDYVVWKAQHSPTMLAQGGNFTPGDPMVDMVGQGRIDLATALQRMNPAAKEAFTKALNVKYPNYSQANYGVAKEATEAFTSGSQGQQLTAIDTARQHMQTFKDTADALDNSNVLLANKLGNAVGMQFGSDKTTNFQIARAAFAGEVGKAFAGANVGVSDRQELLDKINAASSPSQLKGYAETADKLLQGKQDALKRSYDAAKNSQPNFGGGAHPGATKIYQGRTYAQQPDGSWKLQQ